MLVCIPFLFCVADGDEVQPRQGRNSLASGASHWITRDDSEAPKGAAYDEERRRLYENA
jgi:hypothetical protein